MLLRHVVVYIIVYTILLMIMPSMERSILLESCKNIQIYKSAQNFEFIYINVLKAGILLSVWPFVSCAPSVLFVETGCFSMLCFAIACRTDSKRTIQAANKLFWHKLANSHNFRTPELYGVCDEMGVLTMYDTSSEIGIRKPLKGMYAYRVKRDTAINFKQTCVANELFQEEIIDEHDTSRTYRVCTLNTDHKCRTISIFCMNANHFKITSQMWADLCTYGERLASLHIDQLPWAPLIGWDIMRDKKGFVLLEGNLGGNVGQHLTCLTRLGWVNRDSARYWREEVRRSFHANYYVHKHSCSRPYISPRN
jgi:hypothetical protein